MNNGLLKKIIWASASAQQPAILFVCAKYGLPWELGMKHVVENIDVGDMETKDEKTGLHLFMLAAVGGKYQCRYDLGSVFHLIQASPGCVKPTFREQSIMRKKRTDSRKKRKFCYMKC